MKESDSNIAGEDGQIEILRRKSSYFTAFKSL